MLNPNEAEKQLKAQRQPDWVKRKAKELKGIANIGPWLYAVCEEDDLDYALDQAALKKFAISELSDADRRRVFSTLFPKIADALEWLWLHAHEESYLVGQTERKPFRGRRDPEALTAFNNDRFKRLIKQLAGYDPDAAWLAAWGQHIEIGGGGPYIALLSAAVRMGGTRADEVVEILKQSASNQHPIGIMGPQVYISLLDSDRRDHWEFIGKLLLAAQRQEGLRQQLLFYAPFGHPGAFPYLLKLILDENLVRFASTVQAIDDWFGFMWDSASTAQARSIIERTLELINDASARSAAIAGKDIETAYLALWCEAFHDVHRAESIALKLLEHPAPERRGLGLHALQMFCLRSSIEPVVKMLSDSDIRVAAAAYDALAGTSTDQNNLSGLDSLNDNLRWLRGEEDTHNSNDAGVFKAFVSLFDRMKNEKHTFKPLVFPWGRKEISAENIGQHVASYSSAGQIELLIPLLDRLPSHARVWVIRNLVARVKGEPEDSDGPLKPKPMSAEIRRALIELLGDSTKDARRHAAEGLSIEKPTREEVARHEELLQRSADDIRARAIKRLMELSDADALASAQRLLIGTKPQQQAGLEILKGMIGANRSADSARALAGGDGSQSAKTPADASKSKARTSKKAEAEIEKLKQEVLNPTPVQRITEEDAFGLARPFELRPLRECREINNPLFTPAAAACIWSLEDLIEEHKTLELKRFDEKGNELPPGDSEQLLGSLEYPYAYMPDVEMGIDESRKRLPFGDLLDRWESQRPAKMRDADGFEVLRAWIFSEETEWGTGNSKRWPRVFTELSPKDRAGKTPRHHEAISLMLNWALHLAKTDTSTFFLDQLETATARRDIVRLTDSNYERRRDPSKMPPGLSVSRLKFLCNSALNRIFKANDLTTSRRLEGILRAADAIMSEQLKAQVDRIIARNSPSKSPESGTSEPNSETIENIRREHIRADFAIIVQLWKAGDISDDELLIEITKSKTESSYHTRHEAPNLRRLRPSSSSSNWYDHSNRIEITPKLAELVERVRRRVLEIELARGDADTPATPHAFNLDPSGGIDAVIPALVALGKQKLVRGYIFNQTGKAASLSTIIRNSRPFAGDTKEAFAAAAKAAAIGDVRLVELAAYQPRWAPFVEHALGWEGLEESVLWFRSHTRERKDQYADPNEELEHWEVRASELSPLPRESLLDGAVDRAWFERSLKKLGSKRWEILYDAAKYACGGAGHTRARLFADAMQGVISEKELVSRITTKRHQDAARALGLLEIKPAEAGKKQVLARFHVLQEMIRTSRKHGGSALQASEKRAVEIGMENLAWTAGYPDPLRLQWAMEIEEFGELATGPVVVKVGETTVQLAVDEEGIPELSATKSGKPLKSVPPAVKKDKKVLPLVEKLASLLKQTSRVRQALEQAMCRGDAFKGEEIGTLFGHPMLKSMLSRLVFVAQTKAGGSYAGYPAKNGKVLRSFNDSLEPIKASDTLRIAHPVDLHAGKQWHNWQAECFKAERVQPFKQVFRELYVPLESELNRGVGSAGDLTNRYAGQQVQPRQALALFGSRGWVARPEEGVQRTFHREGITVYVRFEEAFYSPAEIDGLTLAGLGFDKVNSYQSVAIRDIPPRLFSEVLRDLDLVVSVAHRGGVDPEACLSTVEMRAALLRETCQLLSLQNVRIDGTRAFITGQLGEYALHLGSGTIHQLPGGTIWVVPVHSQHRGRIFLPFSDDDPKTAEIISKALLLARDHEIQDPSIIAQLRNR